MERRIVITADGSKTIHLVDLNEHYHSIHGAIQEAKHVFIKHGLLFFKDTFVTSSAVEKFSHYIHILEIGLGTGLNAYLTFLESEKLNVSIDYTGVEAYPITSEELQALNYSEALNMDSDKVFQQIHQVTCEEKHTLVPQFSLTKQTKFFSDINDQELYDIIYFDAFGARVQPELWTEDIFQKMYNALKPNGILVTYSAKGSVRRAMLAVGFQVEKLPGPPGKREMLRARKGSSNL
ncbi:tRNA (5-methylaminomethyl-2-thiouridine)(34)-methyltransferase MnmD [Subsaxibacter sp. CAU 1640]|uniref:tRNA (5-methylaminomethyl-2-thiouridine)(34)-methyltransferase MnmD n=1 Tax=Subsaxibacter sp. CAU 1640 TaxID=2933271 RepID=UPI0020054E75|nr:tRNA (5-methylaminomethyl-2-thiouridine)(34)-methyltransferase MnmD [Subsaxibacter sp. CAU 1640]MCK7591431.1 tRNA (5-methylaminomethyl-2-thiouridine)(34)-methyltransferase MnmD [Subsaxibacter sp. CAU 1640]